MNKVFIKEDGQYVETKHGHEERDRAISDMILCASATQAAWIKDGKRAYIDSGVWEGKLVVRVVCKGQIIEQYGV